MIFSRKRLNSIGLLPLSFIIYFFCLIIKPIYKIRFFVIRADRLGHLICNTELMLLETRKFHENERQTVIGCINEPICNHYLSIMWKAHFRILPFSLIIPIIVAGRVMGGWFNLEAKPAASDRDIFNLIDANRCILTFTPTERRIGRIELRRLGILDTSKYVCLIVRDSTYLEVKFPQRDFSYHNFRDSPITDYEQAVYSLIGRGYNVFRMGAEVSSNMNISDPKFIDYAVNGMRSEFLDIFLGGNCHFCISQGTGFDGIPMVFKRPIVYVNVVPLFYICTFSNSFLGIFKHHIDLKTDQKLSVGEIFQSGVSECFTAACFEQRGIGLANNSSNEINNVVLEMEQRVNGKYEVSEANLKKQQQFWSVFEKYNNMRIGSQKHGKLKAKIGSDFLRRNPYLLRKSNDL